MSIPLLPDIWRLIFFYLEHPDVHKLRCIGNRRVTDLVERRESSFYHMEWRQELPSFHWPHSLSKGSDIRILEVVHPCSCDSRSKLMPNVAMPHKLVYLKVDSCNGVSPFCTSTVKRVDKRIADLDAMLPHLRYLYCSYPHSKSVDYIAPKSVTHFVVNYDLNPRIRLPPNLVSLECRLESSKHLEILPLTIESLRLQMSRRESGFPTAAHLLRLVNLKEFEYSSYYGAHLSREDVAALRALPSTLTNLRLISFTVDEALFKEGLLPKSLISLRIDDRIPLYAYSQLPRTLRYLTSRESKHLLVHEHQWNISGGNVRRSKILQPPPFAVEGRLANGLFEAGVEPLPPALQHLRLGAFAPAHMPNWMEQLSTHFVPGLTSLDMRCTSSIESSQFVHLPVTLTLLNFEGATLPKVKHLHRLPKLATLGLHGGILTTSIAKALPRAITALTLAQVSLITKGHYNVSDPTKFSTYNQANPQISPLGHLPTHLVSLKLLPSAGHSYWEAKIAAILAIIPNEALETLIIDIKKNVHSDFCEGCDVLLRFERLKHFVWNTPSYTPDYEPTALAAQASGKIFTVLPPSLTALCVPDCIWETPSWLEDLESEVMTDYLKARAHHQHSPESESRAPPLLRYLGNSEYSILTHFGVPFDHFKAYNSLPERHSVLTTNRSRRRIAGGYGERAPPDPLGHIYRPSIKSFM